MKTQPTNKMQLFWQGGEELSSGQMLAAGAVVWALYSAIQWLVNGAVLDEAVVPAQIIAGAVKYPAGHPHEIFYSQAYSLPQFISGWLWGLAPSPLLHSGIRNFLFLFLSIYPAYVIGVLLTRVPMWGHLAAALTATETVLQFQGTYPQWVFPGFYSNGHFGLQLAVLIPALLLAGCWRTGGFLLGLLPAVHAAMAIVVWPWAALWLVFAPHSPRAESRRKLFTAAAGGILITIAFAIYVVVISRAISAAPPYNITADWQSIHRAFTTYTDVHRRLFPLISFGYLANPLVLFLLGGFLCLRESNQEQSGQEGISREPLVWLLTLGAFVWFIVFSTGAWQAVFGRLPSLVERSMPFRFSNISALLLIPLTVAAIAVGLHKLPEKLQAVGKWIWAVVLLAAGALLFLEGGWIGAFYRGRVATHFIFIIWGLLLALLIFSKSANRIWQVILAGQGVVLFGVFAATTPQARVAVTFAAGFFLVAVILFLASKSFSGFSFGGTTALDALLICGLLLLAGSAMQNRKTDQWDRNLDRWDRISADDVQLIRWLDQNSNPGELILPALFPRTELQPKTGHPVLFELETLYIMTYMPTQSGVIGTMAKELYGLDYADPVYVRKMADRNRGRVRPEPAWQEPWAKRTSGEWRVLGRRYNFRLVLSLNETPLQLPRVQTGEMWTLYQIPQ